MVKLFGCWRTKNDTDFLCHHGECGGAWTAHASGRQKSLMFVYFCLSCFWMVRVVMLPISHQFLTCWGICCIAAHLPAVHFATQRTNFATWHCSYASDIARIWTFWTTWCGQWKLFSGVQAQNSWSRLWWQSPRKPQMASDFLAENFTKMCTVLSVFDRTLDRGCKSVIHCFSYSSWQKTWKIIIWELLVQNFVTFVPCY